MAFICIKCGTAFNQVSCGLSIRARGDVGGAGRHEVEELIEMNQAVTLCPKCQASFNKQVIRRLLILGDEMNGQLNVANVHPEVDSYGA